MIIHPDLTMTEEAGFPGSFKHTGVQAFSE